MQKVIFLVLIVFFAPKMLFAQTQITEESSGQGSFLNYKKSFFEVGKYLTPTLEEDYDVFIFINVDHQKRKNRNDQVPAQHMRILRKEKKSQKVFIRDENKNVFAIRDDVSGSNGQSAFAGIPQLVAISSGAGHLSTPADIYDDTPTGIYRINDFLSKRQRYSVNNQNQVVMYNSLFFDLIYPDGSTSGVALHGTNTNQYKYLGQQKSHGCIRTTQEISNILYENLILSGNFKEVFLADLDNKKRLKSQNGRTRKGIKALFVVFYGYN